MEILTRPAAEATEYACLNELHELPDSRRMKLVRGLEDVWMQNVQPKSVEQFAVCFPLCFPLNFGNDL